VLRPEKQLSVGVILLRNNFDSSAALKNMRYWTRRGVIEREKNIREQGFHKDHFSLFIKSAER